MWTTDPIEKKIMRRLRGRGSLTVVTPAEFLDLGERAAVDQALSRLVKKDELRRVGRGLYGLPLFSPVLGELSPRADEVAKAMARKGAQRMIPSGAYSANLLGLSDQVPAKIEYLTDGRSRRTMIGKLPVFLKTSTPKNLATEGRTSGLVIQALRFLGKRRVDASTESILAKRLSSEEKRQLVRDIPLAPAWMGPIFRRVAEGTEIEGLQK